MVLISRDPNHDYKKEDLIFIRAANSDRIIYSQLRCNTEKTKWVFYEIPAACMKKQWGERGTIFEDLGFLTSSEMHAFIKLVIEIPEYDTFYD